MGLTGITSVEAGFSLLGEEKKNWLMRQKYTLAGGSSSMSFLQLDLLFARDKRKHGSALLPRGTATFFLASWEEGGVLCFCLVAIHQLRETQWGVWQAHLSLAA